MHGLRNGSSPAEINGNEIHAHSSGWPFNLIFRPLPNPTPEQTVRRVVFALDWYRRAPKQFSPNPVHYAFLPMIMMAFFPMLIDFSWEKVLENFHMVIPMLFFVGLPMQIQGQSLQSLATEFARISDELSTAPPGSRISCRIRTGNCRARPADPVQPTAASHQPDGSRCGEGNY